MTAALVGTLPWVIYVAAVAVLVLVAPRRFRPALLTVASLVYYGWGRFFDLGVMTAIGVATYLIGRAVRSAVVAEDPRRAKRWLVLGVVIDVAGLAVFKYADMFVGTVNAVLNRVAGVTPLPLPDLVAPLGISFITFGFIHYLAEMHRGEAEQASPLGFALWASFFPTVTNGPIRDYPAFAEDKQASARVTAEDAAWGVGRIIVGLGKKFIIADSMDVLLVGLLSPGTAASWGIVVGVYAYAIKIYFDFAGYSDMAIGGARLLGYRVPENFNWPYLQRNISDFWSHWHMTLTRFITRYVFIPLGGSRGPRWRTALNTMIAMGVSGLWHGAAWHYVAWGLYHGVGLVVNRLFREAVGHHKQRSPRFAAFFHRRPVHITARVLSVITTFNFVAFGWVLFVLPLRTALLAYERIFVGGMGDVIDAVGRVIPGSILPW